MNRNDKTKLVDICHRVRALINELLREIEEI